MTTISQRYKKGTYRKKDCARTPAMKQCPQVRGTVMRARIVTPRKPNSAKRPVAKVVLVNKKRVTAHIPGIGHTIRRYSKVMISGVGARDLPGVRYSLIRGIMDFHGLTKKKRRRSIYGAPQPENIKKIRRKIRIKMLKQNLEEQKQSQKTVNLSFELPEEPLTEDDKKLLSDQVFKKTKLENKIELKIKNLEKKKLMFLNLFLTATSYINFNKNFFRNRKFRFFNSIELTTLLVNSMYTGYFFDFINVDETFVKHGHHFWDETLFYFKRHQIILSNFFLNIKHNIDFNYSYFSKFLITNPEKWINHYYKKNMLSSNNFVTIYDVFLLNYDVLSKDHFELKFSDNSTLDSNYFIFNKFPRKNKKIFTKNIQKLYKYEVNPLFLDVLDVIKFNSKIKLFINRAVDYNILFSDLMNSAKYKFVLYQFIFSCSELTYSIFKMLNRAFDYQFTNVALEDNDLMYEDLSDTLIDISDNFILDKFTNYFNLFATHISSSVLKINKINKMRKPTHDVSVTVTNNIFKQSRRKKVFVCTFDILNIFFSFNKILSLPFVIKYKIIEFLENYFFLNYSLIDNQFFVYNYENFKSSQQIVKKKIDGLNTSFFKKTQKWHKKFKFNSDQVHKTTDNNLIFAANNFYDNLDQRDNFISDYIGNFLSKFDNLFANYDMLASLYNTNKKIENFHHFFNPIFFKKKIYNIFKMRQKKIVFKKFCQLNDATVSILINFVNNSSINIQSNNLNNFFARLNIFFCKKFNFFKFYFFLKKLINYLKLGIKYKLLNSSYTIYKATHLFNDYRFINNYLSIDNKIKKLTDTLDDLDLKKKKKRLSLLKKLQEEAKAKEQAKKEEEEAKAKSKTVTTEGVTPKVENSEAAVADNQIISLIPTGEILDDADLSDTEDFNNDDFLNKSIDSGIFLKKYLAQYKKLLIAFLSGNKLNINDDFFKSTNFSLASSELINSNEITQDEINLYDSTDNFEYSIDYLNTVGESPNIFDFVDSSALTKYSNKSVFNKLENYFLMLSYRELESARHFKFNNIFLSVGNCNFSKAEILNNDYFNVLSLNEFELKKLNKTHTDNSDESSLDFLDYDSKLNNTAQYFNVFSADFNDNKKNDSTASNNINFFKKPAFVSNRSLFYDKNSISYYNFYDFEKINFKKLFLLTIFKKKIKNNLFGTYFFSFNKSGLPKIKNNNYIVFCSLLKNSNFLNFKKLIKNKSSKKKFIKSKNIKLISEFSWLFF